ncbi:uncharacterized protein LOC120278450 [Dioscorea cayenensis subsp. rotundata]|uniref:Uncharacterized protein LOC120278450 n=1 Tax=Dioscorea cayennensis subsp. rotundata TaxID=55577 RepID=A0AB40CQ31_DIOCR|nr:uncharacterized protein LOC120278450 [Dioscorea cayenensis subsp. rotundata]
MDYDFSTSQSQSQSQSQSLKLKVRSFLCFSCCFREDSDDAPTTTSTSLLRSSSAWVRSTAPEIADRCRSLASRIHRQRRRSVDFTYDPLDYALNFDDGFDAAAAGDGGVSFDGFKYRSFSSRLPASPPVTLAVAAMK